MSAQASHYRHYALWRIEAFVKWRYISWQDSVAPRTRLGTVIRTLSNGLGLKLGFPRLLCGIYQTAVGCEAAGWAFGRSARAAMTQHIERVILACG